MTRIFACKKCNKLMRPFSNLNTAVCMTEGCTLYGIADPENSLVPSKDMVNHPSHYTAGGMEVIDILKAKLTAEQLEGFLLGNVIKYTTRYGHKNGIEDLKKAQWYLNYMVKEKAPTL